MTITDKLNQILEIKKDMQLSLEDKGSDIVDSTLFSDYPRKISELPSAESIYVSFLPDVFLKIRTSDFTNFEYLYKDYKGDYITIYNPLYTQLCLLDSSLKGMFADCLNLKILDMSYVQILQDNITNGMFENNTALTRVMMNHSEVPSIQRLLNALPDHTGALEGEYKFEVSKPKSLFDEIVDIYGTMYKGWTITKITLEQEKFEEEEANNTSPRLSVLRTDITNGVAIISPELEDRQPFYRTYFEDGYFVETQLPVDVHKENFGYEVVGIDKAVKILYSQRFFDLCDYVDLQIHYRHGNFDLQNYLGDYNTKNLVNIEVYLNNAEPVSAAIYGENNGRFKDLLTLFIGGTFLSSSHNYRPDPKDTLKINDIELNNLTNLIVRGFKEVEISNVEMNNLENLCSSFSVIRESSLQSDDCVFSYIEKITFNNVLAPNVYDLSDMFDNNEGLLSVDFSGLTVSNSGTIKLDRMFRSCRSLKQVDLSTLNFTNADCIGTRYMFYGCVNLEKVNLSNMKPLDVNVPGNGLGNYESGYMFYDCYKLKTIIMANCPWYFIEDIFKNNKNYLPSSGILYCDMDMSSVLPSGWIWKHSREIGY